MNALPELTNEIKLAICKTCANIVIRKRSCMHLPIEELQNMGFISIKSNIERKAYSEAYYTMLQAASRPRFNRNDPVNQAFFIGTRKAMGRHKIIGEYNLAEEIDVQDAIMKLLPEEKAIAIMYLLYGFTQKEMCDRLQLSQPTISIKIQGVKDRLCVMLRDYK